MEQGMITISLVIPVFKVSPYIERCLRSVIKQSYNHFECILVDDCSPDDSVAKCEKIIANYSGPIQFRILHHESNRGLSAARNTGTDAAVGDYILYVDSDDVISSDCVEKLMEPVVKDNSIEMVIGERLLVSEKGIINHQRNEWRHKENLRTRKKVRGLFFDRNRFFPPAAWNKLTSREFLVRNQLRFKEGQIAEDTLWSFYVMKHLCHAFCIPEITYFYYCNRPDSISNGIKKEEAASQWNCIYDIISRDFTPDDVEREAAHYSRGFCRNYMQQDKTKELLTVARRFEKAIMFKNYPKEKTLLWAAKILPHNNTGQEIFKSLSKALLGKQSR